MVDFNRGEVVAVMSLRSTSPTDAMSIATVSRAEGDDVELMDGRRYRKSVEQYIDGERLTYIVPATRCINRLYISAVSS